MREDTYASADGMGSVPAWLDNVVHRLEDRDHVRLSRRQVQKRCWVQEGSSPESPRPSLAVHPEGTRPREQTARHTRAAP